MISQTFLQSIAGLPWPDLLRIARENQEAIDRYGWEDSRWRLYAEARDCALAAARKAMVAR